MISAHPLQWPEGWPRIHHPNLRKNGKFHRYGKYLTISDGVDRVLDELKRMGIDKQDAIISTNVRTRLDGFPRSGEPEPTDPGVAVYWQDMLGAHRVMAIDIYTTVADNLAGIAATLESMRAIERHGGSRILERAFTGFTALPAPGAKRTWREILGFTHDEKVTADELQTRYRKKAMDCHPDRPGGSHDAMAELNEAFEQAKREIGA